jgi:hypothetical protein
MPVNTPNRVAHPVSLEAFVPPTILRQESSLYIDYYNDGPNTIIIGEPVIFMGRVCIAQRTILPGKMGTLLMDWIVDAILEPSHSGNILQGQIIYWDLEADAVTPIEGGAVVPGIGAATTSIPDEGFILGRAMGEHKESPVVDNNNKLIVATTSSQRVRVASVTTLTTYTEAS